MPRTYYSARIACERATGATRREIRAGPVGGGRALTAVPGWSTVAVVARTPAISGASRAP